MRGLYLEYVRKDVGGRRRRSLHRQPFIDLETRHIPDAVLGAWPSYDPTELNIYASTWDAFERSRRSLLILGHPGAGKSTAMVLLAEKLLEQATIENEAPIPVIVNLSKFQFPGQDRGVGIPLPFLRKAPADKEPRPKLFESWLVAQMASSFGPLDEATARRWLEEDRIAVLLDGLDEFDDARRADLVRLLNETFLADHVGKPVVLCCRVNEYDILKAQETTTLKLEGSIELQPLSPHQVSQYLEAASATRLMQAVRADPQLQELSRTPLMLAVLAMAYGRESTAEPVSAGSLSDTRSRVFEAYVARMLQRQAQRREQDLAGKEVPESRYLYTKETVDRCLGWLALTLSVRMRTSFSPDAMMRLLLLEHRVEYFRPTHLATYLALGAATAFSLVVAIAPVVPPSLGDWLVAAEIIAVTWALLPVVARTRSTNPRHGKHRKYIYIGLAFGLLLSGGGAICVSLSQWLPLTPYEIAPLLGCLILFPDIVVHTFLAKSTPNGAKPWPGYLGLLTAIVGLTLAFGVGIDKLASVAPWTVIVGDHVGWLTIPTWLLLAVSISYGEEPSRLGFGLNFTMIAVLAGIISTEIAIVLSSGFLWQSFLLGLCLIAIMPYAASSRDLPAEVVSLGGWALVICSAGSIGGLPGAAVAALLMPYILIGVLSSPAVSLRYDHCVDRAFSWVDKHVLGQVALILLAAMRRMPSRSQDFLRATVGAFLLKESAGETEFIHRFLRDYFALRRLMPQLKAGDDARLQAIAALGFQGQAALDTLVEIAGSDEKPACRAAAIKALAHIPSPEASSLFERSVHDRNSEVRFALIEVLPSLKDDAGDKLLEAMELLGDGTEVRALVDFWRESPGTLGFLRRAGKAAIDELLRVMETGDTYPRAKSHAAGYLGRLNDDRITPALCAALILSSGEVWIPAVLALRRRGDPRALDALRKYAMSPELDGWSKKELRDAIADIESGKSADRVSRRLTIYNR